MTYTHRNGEAATPTEPGLYWFLGANYHDGYHRQIAALFRLEHDDDGVMGWRPFGDSSDVLYANVDDFVGQWWGPVTPPWETSTVAP